MASEVAPKTGARRALRCFERTGGARRSAIRAIVAERDPRALKLSLEQPAE